MYCSTGCTVYVQCKTRGQGCLLYVHWRGQGWLSDCGSLRSSGSDWLVMGDLPVTSIVIVLPNSTVIITILNNSQSLRASAIAAYYASIVAIGSRTMRKRGWMVSREFFAPSYSAAALFMELFCQMLWSIPYLTYCMNGPGCVVVSMEIQISTWSAVTWLQSQKAKQLNNWNSAGKKQDEYQRVETPPYFADHLFVARVPKMHSVDC